MHSMWDDLEYELRERLMDKQQALAKEVLKNPKLKAFEKRRAAIEKAINQFAKDCQAIDVGCYYNQTPRDGQMFFPDHDGPRFKALQAEYEAKKRKISALKRKETLAAKAAALESASKVVIPAELKALFED